MNKHSFSLSDIKAALFGIAVGDALGVPAEFRSREELSANPITDMIGYGTYNMPPGTWSDDSSLTFCLAEALTRELDLDTVGQHFVKWYHENYWTPYDKVIDIGIITLHSIHRLKEGIRPEFSGGFDENDNGNGSLMRILPLLFYIYDKPIEERFKITKDVSSITHGHIRSVISCLYYLEFAKQIFEGKDKFEIYENLKTEISGFLKSIEVETVDIDIFNRLLKQDVHLLSADEINSGGYVLDTLEASIWCLLTSNSFEDTVLKAVNLGRDTDTTAAVTGGLAALAYGYESIPKKWIKQIARRNDIEDLATRLFSFMQLNVSK